MVEGYHSLESFELLQVEEKERAREIMKIASYEVRNATGNECTVLIDGR